MRSSLALLLFSLATFVAAAVPGLPSCANSCADQAASTSGCSSTDTTCLCNSKSFVGATKQCAVHACGQDDQTTLNTALSDFCKQGSSSAPQDTVSTLVPILTPPVGHPSSTTKSCIDKCIITTESSEIPSTTTSIIPTTTANSTIASLPSTTGTSIPASSAAASATGASAPNSASQLKVGVLGTMIALACVSLLG